MRAGSTFAATEMTPSTPEGENRERDVVVPRDHDEVLVQCQLDDAGNLPDISARLLNPDDIGVTSELGDQVRGKVLPGPPWDIVHNNGNVQVR